MKTDWLSRRVTERQAILYKFAEQLFVLDSRSAVYWIEHDLLIVSDLHIEKGSFLGQYANPIPHYDSRKTLSLLIALIEDYQPKTVVSLGDSFHDVGAFQRMQDDERELLKRAVNGVGDFVWILGNHDPSIPEEAGGRQLIDWQLGEILLTHEPVVTEQPQIMGHYHPKASVKYRGLKVRGRSLLTSTRRMVMPAFGQYTGGLDSEDDVITHVLETNQRAGFVIADQRVFPL